MRSRDSTAPQGLGFVRAASCMPSGLSAPLSANPTFSPMEFIVVVTPKNNTAEQLHKIQVCEYKLDTDELTDLERLEKPPVRCPVVWRVVLHMNHPVC